MDITIKTDPIIFDGVVLVLAQRDDLTVDHIVGLIVGLTVDPTVGHIVGLHQESVQVTENQDHARHRDHWLSQGIPEIRQKILLMIKKSKEDCRSGKSKERSLDSSTLTPSKQPPENRSERSRSKSWSSPQNGVDVENTDKQSKSPER
ncbi:hypothetical protein NQ317_014565 [Molorchus minor]|uniref:Uncharacterized protein n=1 Tax=Molorchus minor TaxID=1323400 RepID=A0ABQ9JTP1_9CUCU|nr:hypothetical protein NQ317_014565 [Molorchus minor]